MKKLDFFRVVPKTLTSPLCSQNVSFLVKVEEIRWKEIGKKSDSAEKVTVLKRPSSDIACWFAEKNYLLEKSHNAENCKEGDPLCFLEIQFVAKYQKH